MPAEKWDPLGALSRLAVGFQMAPQGAHKRVWNELAPWFRSLLMQAGPKWLPRMGMGFPCHIVVLEPRPSPCVNSAVAGCHICHRPTCLAHSFVNVAGEIVCYGCVSRMAGIGTGEKEQEEERQKKLREARKILGVKPNTAWTTIHKAYRRKAKAAHPDRSGGSEEEFKRIQAAYELLKEEHER